MYALGVEKILYASCSQELHKRLDKVAHTKNHGCDAFLLSNNNRLYLLLKAEFVSLETSIWSWLAIMEYYCQS